jgi:nifR3 family TIM-barrel protein
MHIGSLSLDNPVVLAPLAGITNLPFRLLARKAGCGMVCSEMISSNGLVRQSKKTHRMLESLDEEKPLSIQIFGADPIVMADAAVLVQSSGAGVLDINFGCPVKKVIKTGAGSALMKSPDLAGRIITAVRGAVTIPLTVKIRSGWDRSGSQAVNIAKIAEACGADAVAVHPRTAAQGFAGKSDWSIIAAVKKNISIPVIGNGDIVRAQDAVSMMDLTGCDGVMIGRAAIGNPWIFTQVLAALDGKPEPAVDTTGRFEAMKRYVRLSVCHFGDAHASLMMRSRLGWFVKGLPFSSRFRESIKGISSEKEALDQIDAYRDALKAAGPQ